MIKKTNDLRNGFSLVELSIVLVILGLLTGGILTGQNLIRAAELRSVVTQLQRYETAIYTFKDKYFALPGDMRNATDFWGSAGGGGVGASCFTVLTTDKLTCNGSGDGTIETPTGGDSTVWHHGERYMAWKHLANAGLIEGDFTGKTDSTTDSQISTAGLNVPAAKLTNGRFQFSPVSAGSTYNFNTGGDTNTFQFNAPGDAHPLKPEELWTLDTKLDDGLPGLGKITSIHPDHPGSKGVNCATTNVATTAKYQLDNDVLGCSFISRF